MSLKDTLKSLKNNEGKYQEAELNRPKVIEEWQKTVKKLYEDIREYLTEYESMGLKFTQATVPFEEDALGQYQIDTLSINAPGKTIILNPVGRLIVGALGRVDMHLRGKAFGNEKFMLLHRQNEKTNEFFWLITCPPNLPKPSSLVKIGTYNFISLTKETIEPVIDYLLQ